VKAVRVAGHRPVPSIRLRTPDGGVPSLDPKTRTVSRRKHPRDLSGKRVAILATDGNFRRRFS